MRKTKNDTKVCINRESLDSQLPTALKTFGLFVEEKDNMVFITTEQPRRQEDPSQMKFAFA